MATRIDHFYTGELTRTNPQFEREREEIVRLLDQLRVAAKIGEYTSRDADEVFATEEAREKLFQELRDFSSGRKAGLGSVFGSRKHRFAYLPPNFLLVSEDDTLVEVFPCMIQREHIEPRRYLNDIASGAAWTRTSRKGSGQTKHSHIVERIVVQPDRIEPGLAFFGKDVQVSGKGFETGYVDLLYSDREGRTLMLEVKTRWQNDELLKAIGQILFYRDLFAAQNRIDWTSIRMGIVCPSIPDAIRSTCERVGIECFDLTELEE